MITTIDGLIQEIMKLLPCIYDSEVTDEFKETHFLTNPDKTEILSVNREEIETIANLFDQLYEDPQVTTGYYDPDEDKRNNEVDAYTGLYYLSIE